MMRTMRRRRVNETRAERRTISALVSSFPLVASRNRGSNIFPTPFLIASVSEGPEISGGMRCRQMFVQQHNIGVTGLK